MKFKQLAAGGLLIAAAGAAGAAPEAQALLAASDAIRNPGKPFALTTTLVEYRNSKQVDGNTLTVYSKADANNCHSEHSEESAVEADKKQIPRPPASELQVNLR